MGSLLEELDRFSVDSYPSELDDLDLSALCRRYNAAKTDMLEAYGRSPARALVATRRFLETRTALRIVLESMWPSATNGCQQRS